MNKKILIIIGIVLVVLVAGGLVTKKILGAVGGKLVEKAIEKSAGDGVDVSSEDGSYTIKTENGSVSYGSSTMPKDWPSDLPQYPGSTVAFSGSTTDAYGKDAAGVILSTSDTPETVITYYRSELAAKGWKISGDANANGTMSLSFEKDMRQGVVLTARAENQTSVTISVGEK